MYTNSEIGLKVGVLELGLESDDVMLIVDDYVIDVCFLSCCGCYVAYGTCKHCNNTFWVIKGLELGISLEKSVSECFTNK